MRHRLDAADLRHADPAVADRDARAVVARLLAAAAFPMWISRLLLEEPLERRIKMAKGFLQRHAVVELQPFVFLRLLRPGNQGFQVVDWGKISAFALPVPLFERKRLVPYEAHGAPLAPQEKSVSSSRYLSSSIRNHI